METHKLRQKWCGLACCALFTGLYLNAALHPKVAPHAASQAAVNHIIDEAEPLCRALLPDKNTLHFAAYPNPLFHRSGLPRDLWAVECRNSEGRELVHILWDEDTQRCISISQMQEAAHESTSKMNREAALLAARNWVGRLNIANPAQAANAPGETRTLEHSYRVFLRLPDGLATVWIDAHTGKCFNALLRSYPDTSAMQAASTPNAGNVPHS